MNPITIILSEIVYRPIFNLLIVFLALFGGNLGLAIIILTLLVRLVLFKTSTAQNDMQKQMSDLQPKLNELQEKYKDNPQKLSEETMNVLKKHGTGPLKGCLMTLVQIPVFFGLFYVIRGFSLNKVNPDSLYSFFSFLGNGYLDVQNINHIFFGMDLLVGKNIILTILAAGLIYLQMKMTMLNQPVAPKQNLPGGQPMPDMSKMMGFMNIFLVFMMASFVYSMPSGVGIYIVTTTLFSVIQFAIQYKEVLKAKLGWYKK